MTAVLRDIAREIARALPTRNLLIVNGHGGNRGILEALGRELRGDFGLNLGALHLGAMMSPMPDAGVPEIHAGKDETSAMLALAPDLVRRERILELKPPPDGAAARALILDPAASWPWSSGDKRIAEAGVIGDARGASAEHGKAIVSRVVEAAGAVLQQLLGNQHHAEAARFELLRDSPNEVLITAGYQNRWIIVRVVRNGRPGRSCRGQAASLSPGVEARGAGIADCRARARAVAGHRHARGRTGFGRTAAQPARRPIQVRALRRSRAVVLPADRAVPGRRRLPITSIAAGSRARRSSRCGFGSSTR